MRKRQQTSRRGNALARLAAKGRFGDTELVHVNKREAALLKALGGSGTVNPKTGFREFYDAPGDNEAGANSPQDNTGLDGRGRDRSDENDNGPNGNRDRDGRDNRNSGAIDNNKTKGATGSPKADKTKELADKHRAALEKEYNEIEQEEAEETGSGWQHTPDAPPGYSGSRVDWARQYNRANGIATAKLNPLTKSQLDNIKAATSPVERTALAQTYAKINNPGTYAFSRFTSSVLPGVDAYPTYSLDTETFGQPAWSKSYNPGEQALSFISRSHGYAGLVGRTSELASLAGYPVGKSYTSEVLDSVQSQQSAVAAGRRSLQKEGEKTRNKSVFERATEQLYPDLLTEEDPLHLGIGVSQGQSPVRRAPKLSTLNARRANFGRVR